MGILKQYPAIIRTRHITIRPLLFPQFSDILLLCSAGSWGMIGGVGPAYKLRARFDLELMNVSEGDNLITAFSFYISDADRSIELYTR